MVKSENAPCRRRRFILIHQHVQQSSSSAIKSFIPAFILALSLQSAQRSTDYNLNFTSDLPFQEGGPLLWWFGSWFLLPTVQVFHLTRLQLCLIAFCTPGAKQPLIRSPAAGSTLWPAACYMWPSSDLCTRVTQFRKVLWTREQGEFKLYVMSMNAMSLTVRRGQLGYFMIFDCCVFWCLQT